MTTHTGTSRLALACPAVSLGSAGLRYLSPVALAATMSGAAGATKPHATQTQKRFAMAGIDTNDWPLGPREWTSG